ncbi:interleukin-12 receptor subunit beta-2 [Aegotheles albertisi]
MLSAWIVPIAAWLLAHFTADPCSIPAGQGPCGITEICDKGNMSADTAAHIQPGTNITLWCHLRDPGQGRVGIFCDDRELASNHGGSVSTKFSVSTHNKCSFTCKTIREDRKTLICGITIVAGWKALMRISVSDPPDAPRNVQCIQDGTDGHPTCTWDRGRSTHIPTTYVLQLSNGVDVSYVAEESSNKDLGSLALSKLDFDSLYTVVVAASNELGRASSEPLVFMPIDIVKPRPPNFSVEFGNSSSTSCTLVWHGEGRGQHCQLRHRPLATHAWSRVESLASEKCNLSGLEPHTAYEFQVSCRIHQRGLWSDWQGFQTRTPEAVPTGRLDIWYRQQDVDSQRQSISLFWKALSKSEARGTILRYTVTFKALGQQSSPAETHLTTQTSYTRVTPKGCYKITVTAENSRGRSPPVSIVTDLGTQDLPPPQKVSAVALGNGSILVSWEPPTSSPAPISGYVVEWAEAPRNRSPEAWVKLPKSNLSTLIAEHIEDEMCYQIRVLALYRDRAGPAAALWGSSGAKAPSAGPQMYAAPWANGILVSWEEIPAQQQRGCITGYQIYLQKGREEAPDVYAISNGNAPRSLHIAPLQPGEHYTLWMTASTAAGEGPWGNSELIFLEGVGDWVTAVLTCSFFVLSACACSTPPARKALHRLLSTLVPQWQSEAIPDPANATWVMDYLSLEIWPSSPFLHSASIFEEPKTTQVEEAFVKTDPLVLRDKLLLGSDPTDSGVGQEKPAYEVLPSSTDVEADEQQLPDLYQRILEEVTGPVQSVTEYIANPATHPATTDLPCRTDTPDDHLELQGHPLSAFPTAFVLPHEGTLTLDAVKISCSPFPR